MTNIEIVTTIASLCAILQFVRSTWKGQLSKAQITPDEYDFFRRKDNGLNSSDREFRIQVEKQLIDKTFGFIATKDQFQELNLTKEQVGEFNWNQIKLIGGFISFKNNQPIIKTTIWEWILTLTVFFTYLVVLITVFANDKVSIAEKLNMNGSLIQGQIAFMLTMAIMAGLAFVVLRYFVLPLVFAEKMKRIFNQTSSQKIVKPKSMHSLFSRVKLFNIIGIGGFLYFVVVGILFCRAHPNPIDFTKTIDTKAFADYGAHIAGTATFFAFLFAFASFWESSKANKIQQFETTFFNMLDHFDSIISQISINEKNRVKTGGLIEDQQSVVNGRGALIQLQKDFIDTAGISDVHEIHDDSFTDNDRVQARWKEMFERNIGSLPHYFRYYYTIVKFIMTSDLIDNKKIYTDLLQAKMSSPEMGLIFYNTFYNPDIYKQNGAKDFIVWLNDRNIGLLENIQKESVVDPEDVKAKCKIDFKHL